VEGAELYEYGVVEDDVDEGKKTIASVLTEVTVTVAGFDDDEFA
jgi:phenylpyruvate tautomerase PptA (4-oxalocrotonate tautomerase family)